MADPLDGVEAEIDRCILDLAAVNSLRIARLETLLVRQHTAVAAASTEDSSEKDDENMRKKKGSAESIVPDKKTDLQVPIGSGAYMNHENTTAIGVPVCTATAAAHEHEMVPPPCYGYGGYGYRSYHGYWRNHGCSACDCRSAGTTTMLVGRPMLRSILPVRRCSATSQSKY